MLQYPHQATHSSEVGKKSIEAGKSMNQRKSELAGRPMKKPDSSKSNPLMSKDNLKLMAGNILKSQEGLQSMDSSKLMAEKSQKSEDSSKLKAVKPLWRQEDSRVLSKVDKIQEKI